MRESNFKELNDMSNERLIGILGNLRKQQPDAVNSTQLKLELLVIKLQSAWDQKAADYVSSLEDSESNL